MKTETGLTINKDSITSEHLTRYPKCNEPIQIRVKSVVRPKMRININDWFNKHFTNNGHLNSDNKITIY